MNHNSINKFVAIPNGLFGFLSANELALVSALRFHGVEIYPSHQRLAHLSGMSVSTVKRTLESLREKKLVNWESRKSDKGDLDTNIYKLTIDKYWQDDCSEREGSGQSELGSGQSELGSGHSELGVGSERARGRVRESEGSGQSELLTRLNELDNNIEAEHTNNQEQLKTKKRVVPKEFRSVGEQLMLWWNYYRKGERTDIAWSMLITNLQKIYNDETVQQDIDAIEQTIETAIQAAQKGKPWQSITYRNWVNYNKKQWIEFKANKNQRYVSPTGPPQLVIPDYHKNTYPITQNSHSNNHAV